MKAEILCIGTELLLGQIVNSNAAWLGQQLAELGIGIYRSTVVGDNLDRIVDVIAESWDRADVLILTGGLGPTPDDLTHEAVARFWGRPLQEHPRVLQRIEQLFLERGIEMATSNRKQAMLPVGAAVLPNPVGTAPGVVLRSGGHILLTFPGVPHEMKAMWHETALPLLQEQVGRRVIHSRVLRFVGIAESRLAETVADLLEQENPTVAPLTGTAEVTLRITARAEGKQEAEALIEPVARDIRARLGKYYYGQDEDTMEGAVVKLLHDRGETLSVAESATGGWLGQRITAVRGSAAVFPGGVISDNDGIKAGVLAVPEALLRESGTAGGAVATAMAAGVRKLMGTTWGLSITGETAAQQADPEKPIELVYLGLTGPDGEQVKELKPGKRSPEEIRWFGTQAALDLLRRQLVN